MTATAKTTRIRPGLYTIYTVSAEGADRTWVVEQRQEDPSYGSSWLWFATCEQTGDALDPLPTLRDAKAAVQS
jgi:hypothetical protein